MNTLALAIERFGLTGTAAEIVTAFGVGVEVGRDSTPFTWSGVNAALLVAGIPSDAINAFNTQIQTQSPSMDKSLSSGGVDFTIEAVRTAIASGGIPDAIVAVLLNIGIQNAPRWKAAGLESLPTEAEVTVALTQVSNQQAVAAFMNETLNPLLATEPTPAQIKSAVAAWSL